MQKPSRLECSDGKEGLGERRDRVMMVVFAKGRWDNVRLEASLEMETNAEWSSGWANMTGIWPKFPLLRRQSILSPASCSFKHGTVLS